MEHKNKFAADAIRELQQSLDAVAPYQATELSKQQAVCALSPQIAALRAKGYSWTAVAAMLSEHGVPVSVAALRTYLRRASEEAASENPRTATRRSRDARAVAHPAEPPIVPSSSEDRAAMPASKPQAPGKSPASTVTAPSSAPTAAPRREQEPRSSTFVVRRDTDDI